MKLVHDWYMIQTGAVDAKARKMRFDDSLMGQLIRFVSSHEIGHTLGLRHNMGSSSKTPVEKLRDKAWVEANGHTASIMDYARFNYVAQPEDSVSQVGLFPRIGEYDKWAIQWGYSLTNTPNADEDRKITNQWIIDSLNANPRLWFGSESNPFDPRSQTEDLGDNSIKASEYGIKNLKRVLEGLPEWSQEEGDTYGNLEGLYNELMLQFNRYITHVTKNIGGIYETTKSVEQPGDVYSPASLKDQREAVNFINKQLFQTPSWVIDKNVLNKFSNPVSSETVVSIQTNTINSLLSGSRLNRLSLISNRFGSADSYQPWHLLDDVKKGVWSELSTKKTIDSYRRNLQKIYVEALINILNPSQGFSISSLPSSFAAIFGNNVKNTDIPSIVRAHLTTLRADIIKGIPAATDKLSKYHLQDVQNRIKKALDPNS
jgi:hypothetical protein